MCSPKAGVERCRADGATSQADGRQLVGRQESEHGAQRVRREVEEPHVRVSLTLEVRGPLEVGVPDGVGESSRNTPQNLRLAGAAPLEIAKPATTHTHTNQGRGQVGGRER